MSTSALPLALALSVVAGCGRLGFDVASEDAVALTSDLGVLTGVTSIDVEVCASRSARVRTAVSTVAWPAGWTAATFDQLATAPPPGLVGVDDAALVTAGCTAATLRVRDPEVTLYAYAVTEVADTGEAQLLEASAALHPMFEARSFTVANGYTQRYWIHFPEPYYRDPAAALPALLFLHGNGEDGDDAGTGFDLIVDRGLPRPFTERAAVTLDLPFVVIAPQCNTARANCFGWIGYEPFLDEVVTDARAVAVIDPARFHLTGLSTGGEGAIRYAIHTHSPGAGSPFQVASLVPIASTRVSGQPFYDAGMCKLASVPVWAFHNADDPTQPVTNSRTYVGELAACAAVAPQLDEGAGGHNAWSAVYEDTHGFTNQGEVSVYAWMLAHSR